MTGPGIATDPSHAGGQTPAVGGGGAGPAQQTTSTDKATPVSSGQLGGDNSIGSNANTGAGAALYTDLFHDLDAAGTQTLSEMILNITTLSGKLQESRAESTKNRVEQIKTQLKANDATRIDLEQKQDATQHDVEKKEKTAKILGWLGVGISAALTVVSLGSSTPLLAVMMGASLLVSGVQQGLNAGGVMAKLATKDPTAAKALQGSLMALQVALSIASLKFGSAGSTIAEAADEGGGLAAAADGTANIANTATAEGESVLGDLSEIASQTGTKMATAETGDEQAEVFLEGVDEMLEVVGDAAGDADEGAVSLSTASGDIVSAQKAHAQIAQSEGAVNPEGHDVPMDVDDPDATRINKVADHATKGLAGAKLGTAGADSANQVEIAKLNRALTEVQANLKKAGATQTSDKVILDELEDALKQILQAYSDVMNVAVTFVDTTHQTDSKIASHIGAGRTDTV